MYHHNPAFNTGIQTEDIFGKQTRETLVSILLFHFLIDIYSQIAKSQIANMARMYCHLLGTIQTFSREDNEHYIQVIKHFEE